ncbi:MAG: flagellar basal body rod protein FlgC [Rhodospirillales bacterium]|nr:flagellar basal body rod protein FlgC [Rhodospirillales bacterium]
MDLAQAVAISAAGMQAQSGRLRVVAQNLANADTAATTPGAAPYRRRTVSFGEHIDRRTGVPLVGIVAEGVDSSPFRLRYEPGNPAADKQGYVKLPNVDPIIETMDMRDAEEVYSANLSVMQAARGMLTRTIDMLKQ